MLGGLLPGKFVTALDGSEVHPVKYLCRTLVAEARLLPSSTLATRRLPSAL